MKQKLLHVIDEGREREAELEQFVVEGPANADGSWNAKDHLAHLAWWRRRSANTLNAMRTGDELPPEVPDDDGVQNAIIYDEVKDRSAADVKADAYESWEALRKAVEESSEDDLARPNPRRPESQVWEAVPGAAGHSGTHVWSWLLDIGDQKRALEVARATTQEEERFFTTPKQLAESRYNLACVYGRLGMAAEALPLLRASFEAQPDLARWANSDKDLDPIRNEPAVKELLAT